MTSMASMTSMNNQGVFAPACEQALLKDRAKKAGERSGGRGGGGERGREGGGKGKSL